MTQSKRKSRSRTRLQSRLRPASLRSGPAAASGLTPDVMEQLKQLGELHEQNVLSDDEFEREKAKLLDRAERPSTAAPVPRPLVRASQAAALRPQTRLARHAGSASRVESRRFLRSRESDSEHSGRAIDSLGQHPDDEESDLSGPRRRLPLRRAGAPQTHEPGDERDEEDLADEHL